jgi:hypothetical protein
MAAIHAQVRKAAEQYGQVGNYVVGANIAGFPQGCRRHGRRVGLT